MANRKTVGNNFDQALKFHLQELDGPVPGWMWNSLFRNSDLWRRALTEHVYLEPSPRRRGRPKALDSANKRTSDSYNAAVFVHLQMQKFRNRNNTKRVPDEATAAFFERAKKLYPRANREIVAEYLRENRKYFGW